MVSGFENKDYRNGFDEGYDKGRADTIEECLVFLAKIMPPQPYLLKSKHYEAWKMKTTELRMLRDMMEQLKEQKNG